MANKGHVAKRNHQAALILQDGSIQEFTDRGVLNTLFFTEYPFELASLDTTDELVHYKPSDRYLHELFFPDLQQDWERRNRLELLAEGNARIASPLYNIAFMALALNAIIGGGFSRLGYGRRIAGMAALAMLTRIVGFVVQAASDGNVWLNVLQYAVPLLALALSLRSIFRRRAAPPRRPMFDTRPLQGARA
ncbi:MAG TPA: LptF/LptG family permease, partial [Vineibacter sp.]|nr:LptF/LptG family permease [Vineibacter sp.]